MAQRVVGPHACVGVGYDGGGGNLVCLYRSVGTVVDLDLVCSHLSHSRVLFHFGHSPEQTWRGRGWGDLQDPAEVGGVNGGLLRVEQRRRMLLSLRGQVEFLSCPEGRKCF